MNGGCGDPRPVNEVGRQLRSPDQQSVGYFIFERYRSRENLHGE